MGSNPSYMWDAVQNTWDRLIQILTLTSIWLTENNDTIATKKMDNLILKAGRRLEQALYKENIQAVNNTWIGASLITNKMQIKTPITYHYTPYRMVKLKKTKFGCE